MGLPELDVIPVLRLAITGEMDGTSLVISIGHSAIHLKRSAAVFGWRSGLQLRLERLPIRTAALKRCATEMRDSAV